MIYNNERLSADEKAGALSRAVLSNNTSREGFAASANTETEMSKKRFGDRRDGKLLRDLDSMHIITPLILPNRADNEAFISETIDLSAAEAYLEKRNADSPDYKYNIFQLIITAMLRAVTLRPKLNRFIVNGNMYERNELTAAFVVKKQFSDASGEALAFIHAKPEDTFDSIHDEIKRIVTECRNEKKRDASTESMDIVSKIPRPIMKVFVRFVRLLDKYGWVPRSFVDTDPQYSSVMLSNLGSIKLHAGYHHLTNWGTNSLFVVVGEKKKRPFHDENGNTEMRMSIDLGLTVDERIADGYYFSKSVRLVRHLLENPELLEQPLSEEVDI